MQLNPTQLSLHPDPVKAVKVAVDIITSWLDIEHLRLGGGTTLEARWHHRRSTDLDFFSSGSPVDELFYQDYETMLADLRRLASDDVIVADSIRLTKSEVIHFQIDATPVSLGRVPMYHSDPCDEVERETGVILSSTRDILTKKLYNRAVENQIALERDAYDFAVARTFAPQDLEYAWATVHEFSKTILLDSYRELSRNGSTEMEGAHYTLGSDVWTHAYRMFHSDLNYVPPLHRIGDVGSES